ncbi:hydrogenase small subunit [Venenivibrio stagnispumantis]|uniref:[NiFe]-hydrogenase I apoprotein, small subunit n=1 Tax=Venenivibrio stagnispumantis TaxID=407998 RepID=A0AA45WMW9_9AQUI|nr:hydrogenase small subunit [Venenivibrio stagnispumantis]MCW4573084.1 hydrogenase small subunit [Venenivibrio stagnispumantis]SMP15238.1 [NiFe]-hydrogenase I apoprotein, small subunit [Venenivibrio stagnispumantis]
MQFFSRDSLRQLFTKPTNLINTNKGDEYYKSLYRQIENHLQHLANSRPIREEDLKLHEYLKTWEISRRDFLKWVSATTAMLMLPPSFEPLVAQAAELMNRIPVIWINIQDCDGNTEALIRSSAPTVDELILDYISLEYQETLMAAAGDQAEKCLEDAVKEFKGKYLLFVEGSIPVKMEYAFTTGRHPETGVERVKRLAKDAAAVIAVGACASFGGIPAAHPNPTGAVGVMDVVKGKPIVNIPACPANPANIVGVLLHYVMTGSLPELDSLLRPKFAFGYRIHDNCERRAHFDAGEFVEEWGDEGAKNNFCLYKMGCKGPFTFNNCSIIRYNDGTNWPIGVGRGCIGCSEPDFWDKYATERPVAASPISPPAERGVESTVDEFGLTILTATAIGIGIHAISSALAGKKENSANKEV